MTIHHGLPEPIADPVSVAAHRLGIGRANLYKEIAAGRLRVRKLGRRTLIERSEQERWLAALPHLEPSKAA
jgi:excisionase family DNA binding protein